MSIELLGESSQEIIFSVLIVFFYYQFCVHQNEQLIISVVYILSDFLVKNKTDRCCVYRFLAWRAIAFNYLIDGIGDESYGPYDLNRRELIFLVGSFFLGIKSE